MPSIKDYEKKNHKNKSHKKNHSKHETSAEAEVTEADEVIADESTHRPRRRPGRDETDGVKAIDVETGAELDQAQELDESLLADTVSDVAQDDSDPHEGETAEASYEASTDEERAHASSSAHTDLKFTGSEFLKTQFPKSFDLAENVLNEWMNDGEFKDLPVGHPLAQFAVSQGLRKAKTLEKQILESPVTEKVLTQAFTLGLKASAIIEEVKTKLGRK